MDPSDQRYGMTAPRDAAKLLPLAAAWRGRGDGRAPPITAGASRPGFHRTLGCGNPRSIQRVAAKLAAASTIATMFSGWTSGWALSTKLTT